jgi:hypothetical protein
LWAPDKLRATLVAIENKHIFSFRSFLKYISNALRNLLERIKAGVGKFKQTDPEKADRIKCYRAERRTICRKQHRSAHHRPDNKITPQCFRKLKDDWELQPSKRAERLAGEAIDLTLSAMEKCK